MARPPERPDAAPPGHQRLRLTVAYDGAAYLGWQLQPEGVTVQQRLEEALGRLFQPAPRVCGSSRTDTGVHALGMVVHFDVTQAQWRMTPRKLVLAANAHLPPDIRVLDARPAARNFHARFAARGKQYRYDVWNHPAENPLRRATAWHVPRPLDLAAMRAAARTLVGRHNLRAFASNPGYERASYVRTIRRCDVRRQGPLLTFLIEADGFLYRMCRGIVGTLVQVGEGRFRPEQILPMLESRNRSVAGMSAPAHGLVLWRVFYGRKPVGAAAPAAAPAADAE